MHLTVKNYSINEEVTKIEKDKINLIGNIFSASLKRIIQIKKNL